MSAAALIAGNTVVFKPSEETPRTGAILGELVRDAGLPAGVFNVVQGGPATGQALVGAEIDGVAFTGSAEVGRAIAKAMQEGPYARPALTEMGGKNPAIVTANADLDAAAEGVAQAAFGLSGQKCSACSRAIVEDAVHDEFVKRLAEFTNGLTVGDPADKDAFLGPVVNERSVARFERSGGRREQGGQRRRRWRAPLRARQLRAAHRCLGPPDRPPARARGALPAVRRRSRASARSTRRWPPPTRRSTG